MIGPTPRMLGGGWTIAGAVARCKPIPDPIVAVVSSRKRAVHSPGATAAQRALESYKAQRESCRAIYSTQHIRSSTCGETAEDRERSRRDRHRAKLALPETDGTEGVIPTDPVGWSVCALCFVVHPAAALGNSRLLLFDYEFYT